MKTEQGLLYVAKGEKYIQEAAKSARSAKEAMNDISITIIADKETDHTVFDNLIVRKELVGDPSEASLYFDESPYDKTIYLDTDTHILDDIKEIFDILDNFDIAAAHSPGRYTKANPEYYFEEIPEPLPDFNRGVVGYKKSTEVDDFLEK